VRVVSALIERAIEAAAIAAVAAFRAITRRDPKPTEITALQRRLEFRAKAQAKLDARRKVIK
jgi:hypothetical protein